MNKKYKLKITSDLVKKFSQDSNDYNPIHISPKYASRSLYGEVICHGSLILYLILNYLKNSSTKTQSIHMKIPKLYRQIHFQYQDYWEN